MTLNPIKSTIRALLCLVAALPLLAAADTLERVRSSNSMTLAFVPEVAPFSSQQGEQVSGYGIDLCRRIAQRVQAELGAGELKLNFLAVADAKKTAALATGKADILCTPSPESLAARQAVSFSVPVYTAGLGVLVREDAPQTLLAVLSGQPAHSGPTWRATVNRGLAQHTYVSMAGGVTQAWILEKVRRLGVVVKLLTVESYDQGVALIASGQADAFFSERMFLEHYLRAHSGTEQLQVLPRIFESVPVALGVPRGDEDWRLLVDSALSELYRSGELERLYTEHLGKPGEAEQALFKVYALP
ncbi:amino acid ABC transporter substrate-binding protein [Aquipseudomonas campi]|uniref:Amino acid ABC transporter substrate-binding protein n=1 Tax=Aquipseudomonas campi TaxID=2731681 RepID=A0A6M8FC12_9GAMM|nr:amino acid ABC transporter substrate-binding protein [Pseudomonas campi]QKE64871.1 amino acid ABC transporter substrate-binding protein [Pseudomonas campi]